MVAINGETSTEEGEYKVYAAEKHKNKRRIRAGHVGVRKQSHSEDYSLSISWK